MKVADLLPGYTISQFMGVRATVISTVHPHPLYSGLTMVTWRVVYADAHVPVSAGDWSVDALSPAQDVGELVGMDGALDRLGNLSYALGDNFSEPVEKVPPPGIQDWAVFQERVQTLRRQVSGQSQRAGSLARLNASDQVIRLNAVLTLIEAILKPRQ